MYQCPLIYQIGKLNHCKEEILLISDTTTSELQMYNLCSARSSFLAFNAGKTCEMQHFLYVRLGKPRIDNETMITLLKYIMLLQGVLYSCTSYLLVIYVNI